MTRQRRHLADPRGPFLNSGPVTVQPLPVVKDERDGRPPFAHKVREAQPTTTERREVRQEHPVYWYRSFIGRRSLQPACVTLVCVCLPSSDESESAGCPYDARIH